MTIQSVGSSLAGITTSFSSPGETSAASSQSASAAASPEQTNTQQTKAAQPTAQQLNDAVKSTNDFVGKINSSVQFSVDNSTGQTIVKVMDTDTKQVIKQMPSEDMLEIAKSLDKLKGLLVQQKA